MTVLGDIGAATRQKVRERRSTAEPPDMESRAASHNPRGFRRPLGSASKTGFAAIKELKKASPSRGLLEEELGRAVDAGCNLIGVNNRDLRTFKVDLETALRLADSIPQGVVTVAESGIETGADIARLHNAGYDAFLIGESLMKAESPGRA